MKKTTRTGSAIINVSCKCLDVKQLQNSSFDRTHTLFNLRNKLEVRIVTYDFKCLQHHILRIINCVTSNKYLHTLFIIHYSFLKNVKPLVLFSNNSDGDASI